MSTDQQYVGGRGGRQHEQMHERRIPVHDRFVPFLAPYIMAFLVIPLVELITWTIGHFKPEARDAFVIGWMLTGGLTALVAIAIGAWVTKRVPIIWVMVAITLWCWGFASAFTTAFGAPLAWLVIHFFGSMIFATIWVLMRIDSLRSAAQNGDAKDVWGAAIGLARSRPRNVRTDDAHVIIEVEHGPGETQREIESAAKKLESAVGAIAGRTTVVGGERADTSTITLAMADVFATWRKWPGLSHPGGSFAHPVRTAYYGTGAHQWFGFVRGLPSPLTKFVAPNASFFGAAGMTGYGKSGFLTNAAAEVLSRRDAIVCWADAEKFMQNAGPFVKMLGMGAKDRPQAKELTSALRDLAAYRVELFGQAQLDAVMDPDAPQIGREWTPELYEETGEAAVLVIADEADTIISTRSWEWLSTRGRSLGIFLLIALPRASTSEVPAIVRGSIGSWKTFPIGDSYSDGFTLSAQTQDAGADPTRIREVGLHWFDNVPGVDPRMYPVLAREYQSDPGELRREVEAARSAFTPAAFTPGAIDAMGRHYLACQPGVLMGTIAPPVDPKAAPAANMTPADQAGSQAAPAPGQGLDYDDEDEFGEEDPVEKNATGVDLDEGTVAVIDPATLYDPDDLEALRQIDPSKIPEQPRQAGPGAVELDAPDPDGKSKWSDPDTAVEFDRVLATFWETGHHNFGNQDVMDAMRCEFSASTASRRINGLAETERLVPPGIKVERLGRGRFQLVQSRPTPRKVR